MWTFLERMNWADPSLVFPSLVPSACEGLGLGRRGSHKWDCMDICKRREEELRTQEPGGGQLAQDSGGKEEALGKE